MTETFSIRIDSETKQRLAALSKSMNRSRSFLAAQAIAAYVKTEEWQLDEIDQAMAEMDAGQSVPHDKVKRWIETWGTPDQSTSPR